MRTLARHERTAPHRRERPGDLELQSPYGAQPCDDPAISPVGSRIPNQKMVKKALSSEADAVLLDLEDAVAPDRKAEARGDVVRAIMEMDWRGRPTT
jgi:hypothetical protein